MIDVEPEIGELMPDFSNPRIGGAATRLEAINRVVTLQGAKLLNLAQSICTNGLSPIERFLVIKDQRFPEHHVVIEGNRRATVLILLANPRLIETLEAFAASAETKRSQAKMLSLATTFSTTSVEPIRAVLATDRAATTLWVQLRHTGEGDGVGITRWRMIESARFADPKSRIVVVADLLFSEGELSGVEKEMLDELAWSTFDRFIDSPRLRELLCFEVNDGVVVTSAPRGRVINALREIAFRVAKGEFDSRKQNSVDDRVAALQMLPPGVLPQKSPAPERPDAEEDSNPKPSSPSGSGSQAEDVGTGPRVKPKRGTSRAKDRLFSRGDFSVSEPRIYEILKELSDLPVSTKPNACAVLMRVFLEMSVLHYLTKMAVGSQGKGGKQAELFVLVERAYMTMKKHDASVEMVEIEGLVTAGTTAIRMRELHSYVHNRHYFPAPSDLMAAAGELTPFLRKIWG